MKEELKISGTEEELLTRIKKEAIGRIKREASPGDFDHPNFSFTLFEHLLIGSTVEGQGFLDKNTPISILAGEPSEVVKEIRRRYVEDKKGFFIGPHVVKILNEDVLYEIKPRFKRFRICSNF